MEYKKDYPSSINKLFAKRFIDGAFISSIRSKSGNFKKLNIGIVANKQTKSTIVKIGPKQKSDPRSETTNRLAKILNVKGEVIIGDRALREYIKNPSYCIDLATLWHAKTNLPFVFARLCINKNNPFYIRMFKKFVKTNVKIPYYILQKISIKSNISKKEILRYLSLIKYDISYKELKALKKFLEWRD